MLHAAYLDLDCRETHCPKPPPTPNQTGGQVSAYVWGPGIAFTVSPKGPSTVNAGSYNLRGKSCVLEPFSFEGSWGHVALASGFRV